VKRRVLPLLVLLVIAAGVAGAYVRYGGRPEPTSYRTTRVERGLIVATVAATGTLSAVNTVQVGSQVSGQIKELLVDFNSPVKRGQLLARIDPDTFEAKVRQAQAELESARVNVVNQRAQVERARADVDNARAALAVAKAQTARAQVSVADARRDLGRKAELFRRELIAMADRDTAQVAHDSALAQLDALLAQEQAQMSAITAATAQLKVAEVQIDSAQAQVRQREAALQQAAVDLERTKIHAPVDGVVVSRNVDAGQTLAASLQAPTLFTIANDLTKMQVETSVDEADIGRVTLDQGATFTVDSFPRRTFAGRVVQVRKGAQVVHNVVTYNVVVAVTNEDHKLLPGMTAHVKIVVDRKPGAIKVPTAALRFRPPGVEPEPTQTATPPDGEGTDGVVWVLAEGKPTARRVKLGISDGTFVELLGGDLRPEQEVIVGIAEAAAPAPGGGLRLRF
jgi:HlyD family secretion protein